MGWLTPLWLLGLVPWTGLAVYLFWGRRRRRYVPFLELWRVPSDGTRVRRRVAVPPLAVALALAGLLLAVVGAASPTVFRWRGAGGPGSPAVTVVIDRAFAMSGRAGGRPRYLEAAARARDELVRRFGPATPVELFVLPGETADPAMTSGRLSTAANFAGLLESVKSTALKDGDALGAWVRRRLAETAGLIVVVSDADLGRPDDRIVQVAPHAPLNNAGIAAFAARPSPATLPPEGTASVRGAAQVAAQLMVRVRNDSTFTSAQLRFGDGGTAAGPMIDRRIDLPAKGGQRDYFVDPASAGPVLSAQLMLDDDLPADDRAWIVRESSPPTVEPAAPVGDLQRLIDAYRKARPPGEGSRRVQVFPGARGGGRGGASEPAIIVYPSFAPVPKAVVRPTRVVPHPITEGVKDWPSLDLPLGTTDPPPPGWTALVWAGDRPVVAVRDEGARQAWVALDTNHWSGSLEYVLFWTAVLDWVGNADDGGVGARQQEWAGHPLESWNRDWRPVPDMSETSTGAAPPPDRLAAFSPPRPGAYAREDGARRAFNAWAEPPRSPAGRGATGDDWQRAVRATANSASAPRVELGPAMFLGALACLAGAAVTWRRRATPGMPLPGLIVR